MTESDQTVSEQVGGILKRVFMDERRTTTEVEAIEATTQALWQVLMAEKLTASPPQTEGTIDVREARQMARVWESLTDRLNLLTHRVMFRSWYQRVHGSS